jgi:hypothetical protein
MKTAYKRIATIVLLNLAALTRAQTPTLDYPVLSYGQDAEFTEMNHYDSDGTYYPSLDSWAEENTAHAFTQVLDPNTWDDSHARATVGLMFVWDFNDNDYEEIKTDIVQVYRTGLFGNWVS